MIRTALIAALAAGLAAPAAAAEEPPAIIAALSACRAITEPTARLACYDREAGALVRSVAAQETVVLDRQAVRKTKRSLFGFALPQLPFFGDGKDDDAKEAAEFSQIETPIKTVRALGYGRFRFTIEDGALWETTEGVNAFPKAGQTVSIKKGALGSYFIRFEGARSVKGRRVG